MSDDMRFSHEDMMITQALDRLDLAVKRLAQSPICDRFQAEALMQEPSFTAQFVTKLDVAATCLNDLSTWLEHRVDAIKKV